LPTTPDAAAKKNDLLSYAPQNLKMSIGLASLWERGDARPVTFPESGGTYESQ
jgi:hypothetical protein